MTNYLGFNNRPGRLPFEVHGQQAGSQYNGHYGQRMFHALIASCAESGDLLDGTLRPCALEFQTS